MRVIGARWFGLLGAVALAEALSRHGDGRIRRRLSPREAAPAIPSSSGELRASRRSAARAVRTGTNDDVVGHAAAAAVAAAAGESWAQVSTADEASATRESAARERSARAVSATTAAELTEEDILDWGYRLRDKAATIGDEVQGVQRSVSGLERTLANLTARVAGTSRSLAAALAAARQSAWNTSHAEVVASAKLRELSDVDKDTQSSAARAQNATRAIAASSGGPMKAQLAQAAEVLANFTSILPGGKLNTEIDQTASELRVYEQSVGAAVQRALQANASYELEAFKDEQLLALSNLSNISFALDRDPNANETVDDCP